jgi:hypothetical protein
VKIAGGLSNYFAGLSSKAQGGDGASLLGGGGGGGLPDFISQFIPPIPEAGGTTTTDWVTNMIANAGPRAQPATVVDNSVHLHDNQFGYSANEVGDQVRTVQIQASRVPRKSLPTR